MSDYVLKSPNETAFLQAAYALGYASADAQGNISLIATGVTQDGGNFYINAIGAVMEPTGAIETDALGNEVPVMAEVPGYWARIRVNNGGELPAVPPGFVLYPPVKYLEDGVTPDPDYVQPPYGMIA